jgi:hypothetical protein
MIDAMASKDVSTAVALTEALRPLAAQLAKLPSEEREQVIAAARANANGAKPRLRTVSAQHLRAAFGAVKLGGNAVDDVNARAHSSRSCSTHCSSSA